MPPISRNEFLKQSLGLGFALSFSPILFRFEDKDPIFVKAVKANNLEVEKLIKVYSEEIKEVRRRLGYDLANFSAAYAEPSSFFYKNEALILPMQKIIRFLLKNQYHDGTLDLGNLASPPDTAFILEPLCVANVILNKLSDNALVEIKNSLKTFILKAGEALRTGGIHTPNHRWVVSAALARINDLYPDKRYVNRIDEWFSERVFIDADGHFLERSPNYAEVTDNSFITIARLLKRPKLYEFVRKNLQMTSFLIEPNGDLVTVDSRRQDQFMTISVWLFYLSYRFMAIHDKNADFATITRFIEKINGFEERVLVDLLAFLSEDNQLQDPLPTTTSFNKNFEKFFATTQLVRIRREDTTLTIFGGTDKPLIVGSGRSTSPNFFSFRKGEAILKYMRFSTDFFSTGYFRSNGIQKVGSKYILSQQIEAPYYQPLPEKFKRADGDYAHSRSTDGRFWNKMDFQNRPQSNIKAIETTIEIEEHNGKVAIKFDTKGAENVKVTVELCFKEGGELVGLKKNDDADNFSLENGMGEYRFGKDSIKFGEGIFKHNKLRGLEGEIYTSHFGSLRTEGLHVYLTGLTPFEHTLTIS